MLSNTSKIIIICYQIFYKPEIKQKLLIINLKKMRKTAAQPQICPKVKVKIPIKLSKQPQKFHQQQWQSLKQLPVLSKKQLLNELKTDSKILSRQPFNRQKLSNNLQSKKQDKYDLNNKSRQFSRYTSRQENRAKTSQKQFRIDLKVKVSGGGFRKKVKSVASIRIKHKNKEQYNVFENSPAKRRQQYNSQILLKKQESDPITILKHYYSSQVVHAQNQQEQQNIRAYTTIRQRYPQENNNLIKKVQKIKLQTLFRTSKDKETQQKIEQNVYKVELELSDMEWNVEEQEYQDRGFGVNHNLSDYDVLSLDDPTGQVFLAKYLNKYGYCPHYQYQEQNMNTKYVWVKVKVVGFDSSKNRAVVIKSGVKTFISRLSLKFDDVPQNKYWQRIHQAKIYRNRAREAIKYTGYIDSRKQIFKLQNAIKQSIKPQKYQQVLRQCHYRYARQFLVYWQMYVDYQPFKQMGIFLKQFKPFKSNGLCMQNKSYKTNRSALQKLHYTRFNKMGSSLRIINKKINECKHKIFQFPQKTTTVEQFSSKQCHLITQTITKFIKQTRQVIVSEIIYRLKDSLGKEKKNIQNRYYKLHKYLFKGQVIDYLYLNNCSDLINYYQKFIKWTPTRLSPILKLTISIDTNIKKIKIVPDQQTVSKLLLKPFQNLYKEVSKIIDLESDLVYGDTYFVIPLQKIEPVRQIQQLVKYSYLKVQQFIKNLQPLLKYLSFPTYPSYSFSQNSIQLYSQLLENLGEDKKKLLHSTLYESGILDIDVQPFKKILKQSIEANKLRIMKRLEKQAFDQFQQQLKQNQKVLKQLKFIPDNEDDFVKMKKYIERDCQIYQENSKIEYNLCGKYYSQLLEKYCYQHNQRNLEKYLEGITEHVFLSKAIENKRYEMQQLERVFLEKINQQREQILKTIDEIKLIMDDITSLKNFQEFRSNNYQTAKTFHTLEKLTADLENINYREQLLNQELSVFPLLPRLIRTLQPFYSMWDNINLFMSDHNEWKQHPITQLNCEQIKGKIHNIYKRQLTRLSKYFEQKKNMQAMGICENGLEAVKEMQSKLWIIESFTKQGLLKKPKMMVDLFKRVYGPDAPDSFKTVNLNDLLKKNVIQEKDHIQKTADKAQKIWMLQKKIQQIVGEVKQLHFEVHEKYGAPYLPKDIILTLASIVKENIQQFDILKSQEEAVELKKKINTVYSKVKIIQQTLMCIFKFQEQFFKMFRVFKIQDIASDLQDERRKMNQVTRVWSNIIKHFEKDLQVWEAIDSQSYRNRLNNNLLILKQILEKLKQYFNVKRLLFPRLFFISDNQLITMVVQENFSIPICRLKRLFSVQQFFGDQKMVKGLKGSSYNNSCDKIIFKKSISNLIIIWDRLKYIKQEMEQKMKIECDNFEKSEVLAIQTMKQLQKWTNQAQSRFKKKQIHQLKNNLQQQIKKFSKKQLSFAADCLLGLKILLLDLTQSLIQNNVTTSNDFEWLKVLKVYEKKNSGKASMQFMIKTMSYQLETHYQYVSFDFSILMYLLMTKRQNIHTMLVMHNGLKMCGALHGDKKQIQTIKGLALSTFSHFVQIPLFEEERINLNINSILKGFYIENLWGVINFTQQSMIFDQKKMQIISEAAYEIRKVMISEESYPKIFDIPISTTQSTSYMKLFLLFPQQIQIQKVGGINIMLMRDVYRDISLPTIHWQAFVKYYLLILKISQQQALLFIKILKEIKSPSYLLESIFKKIIKKVYKQSFKIQKQIEWSNIIHIFHRNILNQFSEIAIADYKIQFQELISHQKRQQQGNYEISLELEAKIFSDVVKNKIHNLQKYKTGLEFIIVYGQRDAGKSFLIESSLKKLGMRQGLNKNNGYIKVCTRQSIKQQISDNNNIKCVVLEVTEIYKSSLIEEIEQFWLYQSLPLNILIIIETHKLDYVFSDKVCLFYKMNNVPWVQVLDSEIKANFFNYEKIGQEIKRQLQIFFNESESMPEGQKIMLNDVNKKIGYHCVQSAMRMIKQGKIAHNNQDQIRQIIFMLCLWTTCIFKDIKKLFINDCQIMEKIETSFKKQKPINQNPLDYFYDTQKQVWIEWNVIDMPQYFSNFHQKYDQIYLPLKQTASAIYFSDIFSKQGDISLITQIGFKGSGATKLAKKISSNIEENKCFTFNFHNFWDGQCLQKMIKIQYPSRRADGFYTPYRNGFYTIIIDDLNVPLQSSKLNQTSYLQLLHALIKYRCQFNSSKKISKTRFIINTDKSIDKKIIKQTAPIWLRSMNQSSMKSLFVYILDWFFGNTQNPFSKEVRDMRDKIIEQSIQIYDKKLKEEKQSVFANLKFKNNFTTLCNFYTFLCNVNPKNVKTSEQILKVFHSGIASIYCLPSQLQQSALLGRIGQNQGYKLYNLKNAEEIMIKIIQDKRNNSEFMKQFPIIYYQEFVKNVIEDTRLFSTQNTTIVGTNNMLKIGRGKIGKKTQLKCAKFIATGDTSFNLIRENSSRGWETDLFVYFGKIFQKWQQQKQNQSQNNLQLLVFQMSEISSAKYHQVMMQLMCHRESKTILYESLIIAHQEFENEQKSVTLLSQLQITSNNTQKYSNFVKNCKKYIKMAILYQNSSVSLNSQSNKFTAIDKVNPSIIKYSSIIRIEQEPTPAQVFISIAHKSMKSIYQDLSVILKKKMHQKYIKETNKYCIDNFQKLAIQDFLKFESLQFLQEQRRQMQQKIQRAHKIFTSQQIQSFNQKQDFLLWMQKSVVLHLKFSQKLQKQIKLILQLLQKRAQIINQKQKLQNQAKLLYPKLERIKVKNKVFFDSVEAQHKQCMIKKGDHDEQEAIYDKQLREKNSLQQQCQQQLNSVMPVLQAAEQSLAKVTRDDINQLRSFPNPPLSAARVVQALCFVFNQDHLVKEKVLETGLKVKDYWQHAKKYILNDKLLKRVEQFKPEFIKNFNRGKMMELQKITKKPQFDEDRVFKASSAAGNLSIWMRAIISTYQIMQIIQPKRKLLKEAEQILEIQKSKLEELRNIMDSAWEQYNKKKLHYDTQMKKQKQIQDKIEWLEDKIARAERFLVMLQKMQQAWRKRLVELVQDKLRKNREQSVYCSMLQTYLTKLNYKSRQSIISKLTDHSIFPNLRDDQKFSFHDNTVVKNITPMLLENSLPINNHYIQNIIHLLSYFGLQEQSSISKQQQSIKDENDGIGKKLFIFDESQTIYKLLTSSNLLNNKKGIKKFIVINCLEYSIEQILQILLNGPVNQVQSTDQLSNFNLQYEKQQIVDEYKNQEDIRKIWRKNIFILLNIEQNKEARQLILHTSSHLTKNQRQSLNKISEYNLLIIIQDSRQLSYLPYIKQKIIIHNQLNQETRSSMIDQILSTVDNLEIKSNNGRRFSIENLLTHQATIQQKWNNILEILKSTQNIILHDQNIQKWVTTYNQYWDLVNITVKINSNSKLYQQILTQLTKNQCWSPQRRFIHYLQEIENIYKAKGRQSLATLNQQITSHFLSQQKNPSYPIYIIKTSQKNKSDIIPNIWKSVLQNNSELIFVPSLDELQIYMQDQKQILILKESNWSAYHVHKELIDAYNKFMEDLEQNDDLFDRKQHKFAAYILVVQGNSQGKTDKMQQGPVMVLKTWGQYHSDEEQTYLNDAQLILREFKTRKMAALTKNEKKYTEQLILSNQNK